MLSLIFVGFKFLDAGWDKSAYLFFTQAFFAFFLMLPTKVAQTNVYQEPQEQGNVVQMPKVPYGAKVAASAYAGYKIGKSNLTG